MSDQLIQMITLLSNPTLVAILTYMYTRMKNMEQDMKELKQDIDRIDRKLDKITEQVAYTIGKVNGIDRRIETQRKCN